MSERLSGDFGLGHGPAIRDLCLPYVFLAFREVCYASQGRGSEKSHSFRTRRAF